MLETLLRTSSSRSRAVGIGAGEACLLSQLLPAQAAIGLEGGAIHHLPREGAVGHPEGDIDRELGIGVGDLSTMLEHGGFEGVGQLDGLSRGHRLDLRVGCGKMHERPKALFVPTEHSRQAVDHPGHRICRRLGIARVPHRLVVGEDRFQEAGVDGPQEALLVPKALIDRPYRNT